MKPILMPSEKLKELLGKVYDDGRDGERREIGATEYARRRHDFVFHMTDWLIDLKELSDLYKHPEKVEVEKATIKLIGFLYHVIPHLTTAGRLFLDEIGDPFANDWPLRKNGKTAKKKASGKRTKVSA